MSKTDGLLKQLGDLLARVEAGIANTHAVGDALIERADEVERVRMEDMARQRKMLAEETDPHKLREIEQQYVATTIDRDRARRVGRFERDLKGGRGEAKRDVGEPLIRT